MCNSNSKTELISEKIYGVSRERALELGESELAATLNKQYNNNEITSCEFTSGLLTLGETEGEKQFLSFVAGSFTA